MKRPNATMLVVLLCELLLSACSFRVPELPDSEKFASAGEVETAAISQAFAQSQGEIRAFRGHAKLLLNHGMGSENLSQVLVFERPDSARVEFFATGLNRLAALLITRRGFLHAYDAVEQRVYRGKPSRENIERLLSVPFSPEELMYWLVGRLPVEIGRDCGKLEIRVREDKRAARLWCFAENGRVVLVESQFDFLKAEQSVGSESAPQRPLISYLAIHNGAGERTLVSRLQYSEKSSEQADNSLPVSIDFWLPGPELKGNITFISQETNPVLEQVRDRLFTGITPSGVQVFDLETVNPEYVESFM